MSLKDFDVSHLSASNTLKVKQDIKINTNNEKIGIFYACIENM